MMDDNDYNMDEISVKLRGPTGAKIRRNPHHLIEAIASLSQELLDIYGPEGLYMAANRIHEVYAIDRGIDPTPESALSCGVEILVNSPRADMDVGAAIVKELSDKELLPRN